MEKRIAYYEEGMLRKEQEQLELLNDVDKAVEENQFEVWFQPQIDYASKKIVGAEALIRWNHPEKGMLPPGVFVPLLERSNLITKVDRFVFHTTCKLMQKWLKALPEENVQISINLARQDILKKGFTETVEGYMKQYGIPRKSLHLEITETAYMEEFAKLSAEVEKLRSLGFLVEIDDFGAGYSSLNTLKDINVDKLKLDMKFLSGTDSEKGKLIVAAVINMAKALNITTLAEGIETKEQADLLLKFGCSEMQGYYFSKPVSLEEYEDLLFGRKTLPALA
ncbi:MAG: EAL domain-containing protein [bacterium]|nr:EAL domain-containing protein [bacterium]